jgi:hypothetical protein
LPSHHPSRTSVNPIQQISEVLVRRTLCGQPRSSAQSVPTCKARPTSRSLGTREEEAWRGFQRQAVIGETKHGHGEEVYANEESSVTGPV